MDTICNTAPTTGAADAAVFAAAYDAWCGGSALRQSRVRYKDFTYGRQWGDKVETPSGHIMTEGEYSRVCGRTPQTNNIIRQLVKTIVGRFRAMLREDVAPRTPSGGMMSQQEMAETRRINALDEIDARMLEEFLISGCAIQKVVYERRLHDSKARVWVDNVSPSRFFVNRFRDPRGWDIELVGMLHDMSLTEAVMRFSHGDATRRSDIVRAFASADVPSGLGGGEQLGGVESPDYHLATEGRCRVIEVWTLESREVVRVYDPVSADGFMTDLSQLDDIKRINRTRARQGRPLLESRRDTTLVWRFRFFAPDGTLLDSGLSPYAHGMHPFVVKFFPMTDGEVHSFVEDVVDQQRHVNRLLTLIDHIMTFSAKGVLLYPIPAKPKEYSWERIVSEWSCCNGVVPYVPSGDIKPAQVVSNGADAGAHKLLSLELQLLDRISGVSGALRGETPVGNEGATMYESRVEKSMTALLEVIESFNAFRADRDAKVGMTLPV